jgi:hypothetical protein
MSESTSLINLGDLSKPATVLIERVSDAVGAVFQPIQIKRLAKAEAEAERIRALARIEITELEQRAMLRMVQQEARKQENIESITAKAIGDLDPDAKPEAIEQDWLANFFDKCDLVSDQEMQSVWGRILAGEANRPGTFSKRTIELVNSLDKKDAHLFTTLCGFAWVIGGVTLLVYDLEDTIYTNAGLQFEKLTHLESLGLIRFEALSGFERRRFMKSASVAYHGQGLRIEFPKEKDNRLTTGHALLTAAGQQLAPLCGSKPVDGFMEYVLNKWAADNVIAHSVWPNK